MGRVVVACAVLGLVLSQPAAAATPRVWPGLAIGYRDLTGVHGYHRAIVRAVEAWNRLEIGVRFVPAPRGASTVQIVYAPGRCLAGTAGSAPTGFQRFGARVVVRSCPAIVRPLLVAHELGRVLGLANDDRTCSLMNSRGASDGSTFAVPAHCSRSSPWLARLVDPATAAVARRLYLQPAAPEAVALTARVPPRIAWRQPASAHAQRTVVLRATGRCPTRADTAGGSATVVYDRGGFAGLHWADDADVLAAPGSYCYSVFNVSASGRPSPAATTLTYVVPAAPVAAPTVASPPRAGTPASFADRSFDPVGTIVHWHWDFGDPASGAADVVDTSDAATGRSPTHTYAAPGMYTVTLGVMDDAGRAATATIEVIVAP
jgi:hypothetical protein